MEALLDHLRGRSRMLTIYDFDGTDEQLRELSRWLSVYGVVARAAETDREAPKNVAVLHQGDDVIDACSAERLLARVDFEGGTERGERPPRPGILSSLSPDVSVLASQSVQEMVRISRNFERRALRESGGELHAGFQRLSRIADSDRTMEMYRELARTGVDVRVYGYPDASLEDEPFTVIEDEDRELEQYWFLLYDGDDSPDRKAALVSEEQTGDHSGLDRSTGTGTYESFSSTDAGTVDELFELAWETHLESLSPA